jgi:hypothetical protein
VVVESERPVAATNFRPAGQPSQLEPCHSLPLLNIAMASTQRPIVFMDVNIGETPAGRLKLELFSDIVPKYVALGVLRSCTTY